MTKENAINIAVGHIMTGHLDPETKIEVIEALRAKEAEFEEEKNDR